MDNVSHSSYVASKYVFVKEMRETIQLKSVSFGGSLDCCVTPNSQHLLSNIGTVEFYRVGKSRNGFLFKWDLTLAHRSSSLLVPVVLLKKM